MRLKKVLSGACIVSLFVFSNSACSENQPEYDNTIVTSDTTLVPPLALPGASDISYKAPASIINFDTTNSLNVNPIIKVPTQTISAKNTAALNPEHGKPGHRCDIAVGAPLNSSQNSPPQQIQPTTPTLVQSSPAILPILPSTTSGRINPPHGEPGHDCAIAVGQPLK